MKDDVQDTTGLVSIRSAQTVLLAVAHFDGVQTDHISKLRSPTRTTSIDDRPDTARFPQHLRDVE